MEKIFLSLFQYFEKHRAAFYTCLVASFLCTGYFASRIQLEEDITAILPKDEKTEKLNEVFQHSRFLDKLVFTISLKDSLAAEPDSLVTYADSFVTRLAPLHAYINRINDKVDDELIMDMFSTVQEQLPLYLEENDYRLIDSLTTPQQLQQSLVQNVHTLSSPAGVALKKVIVNDPVGISFIALKKLQQLQYDENFDLYDGYVMTKDKKHLLFFLSPEYPPNNTGKNAELLNGLDGIIVSLQLSGFRNINATYYGATAVSAGNALQIRKDNLLTQGIAVLFIIVFIAWYFRKKRAPFLMLLPVAFGALFSLAIMWFVKGKISVIALGTGSIVLGIAINYALHVFNHYRHTQDMRAVLKDLSAPMTIGGFTTIGGFLCLQFTQSNLLKDVGLFAAFCLVGASLFSLVFLPHLIAEKKRTTVHEHNESWLDKISMRRPEFNKWLIVAIAVLTVVFAYTSRYAGFESDMMNMNYMSPSLKKAEAEMNRMNAYALQSIYVISSGKDLDEALQKNEQAVNVLERLETAGSIKKYSGVAPALLSSSLQQERINRWNAYWTNDKKQVVVNTLIAEGQQAGYNTSAFENFRSLLDKNYASITPDSGSSSIKNLLGDFIIEQPGKTMLVTLVKAAPGNKDKIYAALENKPGITVVDKQYFTNKLVDIINIDFTRIALMSSLLVFSVLLLTYGRIELALATFIPMLITWVWILGIMGMAGIKFNIINIIISTLIFGLGDDYSIFIMDGLLQEYKTGKKILASYKSSILLSAITTIAGLGVLIFAKHPALRSIALISIIGICCVVIMAQILIPFFFNLLIKNRVAKNKFPWTFTGFLKSMFAFSYFIFGCILLNIAGFFLIKLSLFGKAKSKIVYHAILSKFAWSLMYIMGNVTKKVINPLNEQFEKPAVVIANHQSFLDILSMVMLNPKLLLLTNSWVWNSPFFGNVVRMAGYYPVTEGAEQSIDQFRESVARGYSIVVFPEGTRSPDGNMKRFHKGAFFLAEQLSLDVLPVLIHGTGYTMSKSDFLLKDGTVTIQYLPRIKAGDTSWGEGFAARTKKISAYFKKEYQQLRNDIEKPAYFREKLIYNYLYKGPVLEWYMKVKLSLEKNYTQFDALIPATGNILDIGCGYGFLSYMLHFMSGEREITGIDYDEEKIAVAAHCFSKSPKLHFFHADVLAFDFETYDSIVLSDILHYLQSAEQQKVVEKCISHLRPGGNIIIRDGNKELAARHTGTRLSEFFSTKLLGFNKTSASGLSFLEGSTIQDTAKKYNMNCTILDETKLTSNIIFILTHKA